VKSGLLWGFDSISIIEVPPEKLQIKPQFVVKVKSSCLDLRKMKMRKREIDVLERKEEKGGRIDGNEA
jgi:hypothetical protein